MCAVVLVVVLLLVQVLPVVLVHAVGHRYLRLSKRPAA